MSSITEIDTHFVKCIGYLYASSKLRKGDHVPLQYVLEEAIKNKYGIVKDYTDIVQSCLKSREEEFVPVITTFEESKASNSDNELELDLLLKEDLMCIICNGMDVGARNRLLECSDCHNLYHQECHKPGVTEDFFENWVCYDCTEASKKLKLANSSNIPVTPSPNTQSSFSSSIKSSSKSSSSSHRHSSSSSYKSTSYSKSSDKYKSSSYNKYSSGQSSSSSKISSPSSQHSSFSSSGRSLPPNINIISADKRIQIMKKKAATKLQEKRKLPR